MKVVLRRHGKKMILVFILRLLLRMTGWIIPLTVHETRNPGNRPSFGCKDMSLIFDMLS